MNDVLHVLIVEDSIDDMDLLLYELKKGGFELQAERVDTADAMRLALSKKQWDIVLSDFQMPQFSGLEALQILKSSHEDIPFIFVSGAIGEDTAVAAMKSGASDYVMKGRLKRLIPVIQRSLQEANAQRERKKSEETLRRYQLELAHRDRVSLMGEMASTLAHELNQPLTAITIYTQLCIDKLQSNSFLLDELIPLLTKIANLAKHQGDIIHHIKNFVRKGDLSSEVIDMKDVVRETLNFIHCLTTEQPYIRIDLSMDEDLPPIIMDKIQIQQVILNLVRNSIEAMQEIKIKEPKVVIHTSVVDQKFIQVTVSDNGPGFAEDKLPQLFDPYFTTKPTGTGMGLAICRSFIEAHGGNLTAQLNPMGGAQFRFILPIE